MGTSNRKSMRGLERFGQPQASVGGPQVSGGNGKTSYSK